MSATNVDLGNVEYIYLDNTICNVQANGIADGAESDVATEYTWNLPYIKPQESPIMYIQVCQAYMHYSGVGMTGEAAPQHLEYTNIYGQNFYCAKDDSTFLACMLQQDTDVGHWKALGDAPMIQVPTTLSKISFAVVNNRTGNSTVIGDTGSLSILLKVVRPKQMEITKNTVASFAQRLP